MKKYLKHIPGYFKVLIVVLIIVCIGTFGYDHYQEKVAKDNYISKCELLEFHINETNLPRGVLMPDDITFTRNDDIETYAYINYRFNNDVYKFRYHKYKYQNQWTWVNFTKRPVNPPKVVYNHKTS